jgi:hypothetical protein
MAVTQRMIIAVCETEWHAPEGGNTRASIAGMSNSELLRFGVNVKFRLSQGPGSNDPEPTDVAAQLNEARAEWNRRHPNLPLRDSF